MRKYDKYVNIFRIRSNTTINICRKLNNNQCTKKNLHIIRRRASITNG